MIFGLSPVIKRTLNQRGPTKNPPMMKLVTFELSVWKKYSLKMKLSESFYLSSKKPYIVCVCGTVICLVTVPNVEESGELGVTSITVVEVTWVDGPVNSSILSKDGRDFHDELVHF